MRMEYLFLLPLLAALVITMTTSLISVNASTGMSNCTEEPESEDCNPQPDRVGNDHDEDNEVTRDGPDDGEENCWGKVTSDGVNTNDGDGIGGKAFGQHASDAVRGDEDNETPREGVGNQNEDHPSDHADSVGGAFSNEDCIDRGNPGGE
jgi:hypothetical protein